MSTVGTMSLSFLEAIEAKAKQLLGPHDSRITSAVCYTLWLVQARALSPMDEMAFTHRVRGCSRARLTDPVFDKAVQNLVTYAINRRQR